MKRFLLIFLLLPAVLSAEKVHPYAEKYPSECRETLDFYKIHKKEFEAAGEKAALSGAFLFAIIAPEFSQYGYLQDKLESASLKVLYVQGGKNYSDFSIGYFQMKPSFIENMEESLRQNEALKKQFSTCLISDPGSREARVERVKRLEQWEWQLQYLSLFCALVKERFPDKSFATVSDELSFYASAYNTGFHKTEQEIEAVAKKALFPHFSFSKYRYSEIAVWFYNQI